MSAPFSFNAVDNAVLDPQFSASTWPNVVHFSSADIYSLDTASSFQIDALGHFHLVQFDSALPPPWNMTLQLPVMENLPQKSRVYFFYCEGLVGSETLTFTVVPGSGDTVNQNPISYTATFPAPVSSSSALFLCVGIKGNYVIKQIGSSSSSSISTAAPPTIQFNLVSNSTPWLSAGTNDYPWGITNDFIPQWDPAYLDIVPGMEGYVTYDNVTNPANPTFLCHHTGIYAISYYLTGQYTHDSGGTSWGVEEGVFAEYDNSPGNFLRVCARLTVSGPGTSGPVDWSDAHTNENISNCTGQIYVHMTANNRYDIRLTVDPPTAGSATFTPYNQDAVYIYFSYITDAPVPAPLAPLAAAAAQPTQLMNLAKQAAPVPMKVSLKSDVKQQIKDAQVKLMPSKPPPAMAQHNPILVGSASALANAVQLSAPSPLTLTDIEKVVKQLLEQRAGADPASAAPAITAAVRAAAAAAAPSSRKRKAESEVEQPSKQPKKS